MKSGDGEMEKLKHHLEKCELNLVAEEGVEWMVFVNDDKNVSRKLLAPVVCAFFEK